MIDLERIDIVRERTGCSYQAAKEALEQTNGDVLDAIILLENRPPSSSSQAWVEQIQVKGAEVAEVIKALVREGNVRRIRVLQDGKVLLEFPVTAGVIGAVLLPKLALIGAVVAMVARCTIEVERVQEPRDSDSNITPPNPTEPEA
ncbi:MAG: DUF4342 domain-containing protein [Bacillota bacterium]|jgi:hypothetical protein